jgi:hypothetical protein
MAKNGQTRRPRRNDKVQLIVATGGHNVGAKGRVADHPDRNGTFKMIFDDGVQSFVEVGEVNII